MTVYTSYYARANKLDPNEYLFVQISRSKPPFAHPVVERPWLFPSQELLYGYKKGTISEEEYDRQYTEQISKINLAKDVEAVPNPFKKKICYLCWEGKGKFCHRHIFARELKKTGIEVIEI